MGGALRPSLLLFYSKMSYKNPLGLKVQHKILTQGKGPQKYTWGKRSTQTWGGGCGVECELSVQDTCILQQLAAQSLRATQKKSEQSE